MADPDARQAPVLDIVRSGDDLLIRTDADVRPEDVRVDVRDGVLEVRVPRAALRSRAVKAQERREAPDHSHPSGTAGAEPPLGSVDEQDLWNAQKPLISEDRVTSIHLEGFTDEQANEVLEALGDDAPEEAQGGSATGSDVFPAHGGFPSRNPEQEEPS
ncbi:MAG TPA: hypothetical protein VGK50_08025 [Coriobacteriia bacterium]|jgi:hypothetical protein